MAKGKHAAALFEVIHSGRFSKKPAMKTPTWWFKRNKSDDPTISDSTVGNTGSAEQVVESASDQISARSSDDGIPRPAAVDFEVDPDRHQITFRVSYTSAIITGFAILVAVSLAYVVGKKMNQGPSPAIASESTEQLRVKPARPDVLNITPPPSSHSNTLPREPESAISSRSSDPTPVTSSTPPDATGAQGRLLGLNYVVVQSYPDEKSATDAKDALVKAGINCTIEQKLRGLNPSWYTVVGLQGFTRISGAEYGNYLKKIEQISTQFAQGKRSFKAFSPLPYKWDKAE